MNRLPLLFCAALASCSSGTFVLVTLDKTAAVGRITSVDLELMLDGRSAHATFGGDGELSFPTQGVLKIGSGDGKLDIVAIARDGAAEVIRQTADVVIAHDQTATVNITFGAAPGDGGTDGGGVAKLSSDRASFDFGTTVINTMSSPATITISNSGGMASGVLTATLGGADNAFFSIATDGCTGKMLDGGASCQLVLRAQPTAPGMLQAMLTVDGMPGGSATTALTAEAVPPGALAFTPVNKDFNPQVVGGSDTQMFTVKNGGGVATGNITMGLSGSDSNQFSLMGDTCTGVTLAPNATCTLTVKFAPTSPGSKGASLTGSANPGGISVAPLTGTGLAAAGLAVEPSPRDLGSAISPSGTTSFTFTVRNTGGGTSGTIMVSVGGADASLFSITNNGCAGMTLTGGGTCPVTVTFTASSNGLKTAMLNASASPGGAASATMTATGIAPGTLVITPSTHDFLNVVLGQNPTQMFTVKNTGGATSGAITMSLQGTNAGDFQISSDSCTGLTLDPMATCPVTVRWNATTAGAKGAQLRAAASPGGPALASLSGTAITATNLGISPTPYNYGSVNLGANATQTFTVTNSGGQTSPMLTVGLSDTTNYTKTTDTCTNQTLATNQSCQVGVQFNPTTAGVKNCTLTVGAGTAMLSGTGRMLYQLTVNVTKVDTATGTVSSAPAGINSCATTNCNANFADGTVVTLTAAPGAGFYFQGWSGSCTGTSLTCMVTVNAAKTVGAVFTPANVAFVSSNLRALNSLGSGAAVQTNANAQCQAFATAKGFPGTYVAWISLSNKSALSQIAGARGWVRPDGKPVADTPGQLAAGQIFYPPLVDENGNRPASATFGDVLTGTGANGVASGNCLDWTSLSDIERGDVGNFEGGTGVWTVSTNYDCEAMNLSSWRIYCFGTKYTAAVQFQPAAGRLAFKTVGTFNVNAGIGGANTLCTNEAAASTKTAGKSFKALLATPTASAASLFNGTGAPWVRTDGVPLVASAADLLAAAPILVAPLTVGADGTTYSSNFAVTGAASPVVVDNSTPSRSCAAWTNNTSSASMWVGAPQIGIRYFAASVYFCSQAASFGTRVYCLEQ